MILSPNLEVKKAKLQTRVKNHQSFKLNPISLLLKLSLRNATVASLQKLAQADWHGAADLRLLGR